jgi:hypothetical protein
VVNSGDTIYNPIKGRKERIGRLLQMHANKREEIDRVSRAYPDLNDDEFVARRRNEWLRG